MEIDTIGIKVPGKRDLLILTLGETYFFNYGPTTDFSNSGELVGCLRSSGEYVLLMDDGDEVLHVPPRDLKPFNPNWG